jgi:hypothetical protein
MSTTSLPAVGAGVKANAAKTAKATANNEKTGFKKFVFIIITI